MRPGRLGAQKAIQELRSSGTCPLACFLHRRIEDGLSAPQPRPPATREPSPLALARPLALRLLLGAKENSPGGGWCGFSAGIFFFFYLSISPG